MSTGESRPLAQSDVSPIRAESARPGDLWLSPRASARDLDRFVNALRRRHRALILGFASVFVVTAVATLLWPKTYESTATVLVEKRTAALEAMERLARRSQVEAEIELIRSRRVLEAVVDESDLHVVAQTDEGPQRPQDVFDHFEAGRQAEPGLYSVTYLPAIGYAVRDAKSGRFLGGTPYGYELRFAGLTLRVREGGLPAPVEIGVQRFEHAVKDLAKKIRASRVARDVDLIEIRCSSADPEQARGLAVAVLANYTRLRSELQRSDASTTVGFLNSEIGRIRSELSSAEDSLREYSQRSALLGLEGGTSEEVLHFTRLRAQRDQLQVELVSLSDFLEELQVGVADEGNLAGFAPLLKNEAVTQLLVSLVDLENRRSELALRRSEQNPDLIAVDARIADVKRQLRSIATSYKEALDAQIASLDGKLRSAGQRLSQIPRTRVQSARLERKVALLDELYRLLQTRLRETEVADAIRLPNVDVVDPPSLPFEPASPRVALNLALGILMGLAYGGGLVAYRELTDPRVRGWREVERETGLPVLGSIPWLQRPGPVVPAFLPIDGVRSSQKTVPKGKQKVRKKGARLLFMPPGRAGQNPNQPAASSGGALGQLVLPTPNREAGPLILRSDYPDARELLEGGEESAGSNDGRSGGVDQLALESFRILGTDLKIVGRRLLNEGLRSVAITSTTRGEGKTFTACNLALTGSAQGARTLLIDGDMRAGGVTRFFDLPPSVPGLSDALTGRTGERGRWSDVGVRESELWVLPAGELTPDSPQLLEAERFKNLVEEAKESFDLVVVDTPPVPSVTDALIIAFIVDAILLVVREGFTDRDHLESSLTHLTRTGAPILGVVLNASKIHSKSIRLYDYSSPGGSRSRRARRGRKKRWPHFGSGEKE